jgi:hypothetical protein
MHPTPYPDVNVAVHDLLSSIQTILGDHFRGMYLSGSLALGDFASYRSDIDFVVVTDVDLSDNLLSVLRAMHARFNASDSSWATEVEAAYIPQDALRRYDPAHARHPHIERGAGEVLAMDQLGSDWIIQRYILREHGVVIAGPDPRTLIDPVQPDDRRWAMAALMNDWWGPMRDHPDPLDQHHIGYQSYAVLTMCRILYTIEYSAVVSKPVAARWAQNAWGGHWAALIEHALSWRKDHQDRPSDDDMSATLDFIAYTLERCRVIE